MTNGRTWKLEAMLRVTFPMLIRGGFADGPVGSSWAAPWDEGVEWAEHRLARRLWGGFPAPGLGRAGLGRAGPGRTGQRR